MSLSYDIWEKVFSYFPSPFLCKQYREVCRDWDEIIITNIRKKLKKDINDVTYDIWDKVFGYFDCSFEVSKYKGICRIWDEVIKDITKRILFSERKIQILKLEDIDLKKIHFHNGKLYYVQNKWCRSYFNIQTSFMMSKKMNRGFGKNIKIVVTRDKIPPLFKEFIAALSEKYGFMDPRVLRLRCNNRINIYRRIKVDTSEEIDELPEGSFNARYILKIRIVSLHQHTVPIFDIVQMEIKPKPNNRFASLFDSGSD